MLCICTSCYHYQWWICMSSPWHNVPSNKIVVSMSGRTLYTVLLSGCFTEHQRSVIEFPSKHCCPLKFSDNIRTAGQQSPKKSDWLLILKHCHKRTTTLSWQKCRINMLCLWSEDLTPLQNYPYCELTQDNTRIVKQVLCKHIFIMNCEESQALSASHLSIVIHSR